jgi:hypothetical protein
MNMIFMFIFAPPSYWGEVSNDVSPEAQPLIGLCGPDPDGGEVRCLCGSLLARLVPEGVELKCRRCKRTAIVPLASIEQGGSGTD